ncbi:MAG: hypothetical protein I3273_07625 [Candidatus Moeniiplasma glomeromycotorum]|nr:hypothetical protein [Candidatus Moeniiplasma glomeromycotorum]MCE8168427.1 hypothetical protein [Candidatus Moeniiplasma glomeromycotorum]MCE8169949.1 hypothetical protein [Candidatus Moeniiplasma glomeromycotorum]
MVNKKIGLFSRIWKWIKGLFFDKNKARVNKSNNKEKNVNSPQINAGNGNNITVNNNPTYNTYNNFPNKGTITSPSAVENKKKDQKKKIKKEEKIVRQNQTESKEQSEKKQKMSRQEFERLLMKVKFIAFGIMGNIKWDKIKPLEFRKDEECKEFVKLVFEVEKKLCGITYEITKKDKQRFLKTNISEIVERFITLHLVNGGRNDYFDYHCPDCKQTTLTRSLIVNSPSREEAICCNLCRWAMSMKVYREYLNHKKYNPSLGFYEWLGERNRRMAKINSIIRK